MNQYAVWGNPIAQSKSPLIHQLFAIQMGKAIKYTAQLGDNAQFECQLHHFFAKGAKGANITAPFKERAFRLADIHSERSLQAQACNTLKRLEDGRLYADNTDGLGLIADLKQLGWFKPNQHILILGAGGATKGVLYPLLQGKQHITIYNRTTEKAVELVQRFTKFGPIQSACLSDIKHQHFDLIINATSLGLQGKYIELPDHLLQQSYLYDMQYAHNQATPFLNYARSRGASSLQDGLGMLVGQAAFAFQLWENALPEIRPVLLQLQQEMTKTTK